MRILLESDSKFWVIINRKKKFKFNFLLKNGGNIKFTIYLIRISHKPLLYKNQED